MSTITKTKKTRRTGDRELVPGGVTGLSEVFSRLHKQEVLDWIVAYYNGTDPQVSEKEERTLTAIAFLGADVHHVPRT